MALHPNFPLEDHFVYVTEMIEIGKAGTPAEKKSE